MSGGTFLKVGGNKYT